MPGRVNSKFAQIRVKSIDYLQEKATAVYFYDISPYFEENSSNSGTFHKKRKVRDSQEDIDYWPLIAGEFKSMLLATLMFLEILLEKTLSGPVKSLVQIVVQQINMLLSLVNDSLDLAAL